MLVQDQILDFIKETGPTLPARVAKVIKQELLITSAHLADLVSQRKLVVSNLKVGASPLYYITGQEEKLLEFAQGNLNPKDYDVLMRLKENKVLREESLELLPRVALRNMKDFAIPLQVRFQGKTEVFWKWHLIPEQEVKGMISAILNPPQKTTAPPKVEESSTIDIPSPKDIPEEIQQPKEEIVESSTPKEPESSPEVSSTPVVQEPKETKQESQKTLSQEAPAKEKQPEETKEPKTPIAQKPKPTKKPKVASPDKLVTQTSEFLEKLNILITSQEVIRKNSEANLVVKVPSVVGQTTYYCKTKSKARCDEKDLSVAYMEAQIKKLPLLFLYAKDITPKAKEMLKSEAFENILVKKIE